MKDVSYWTMRAAKTDGVVFDYGGVLAYPPPDNWPVLSMCEAAGLTREALRAGFLRYRNLFDGDLMSGEEMYRKIFADNGCQPPDDMPSLLREDSEGWTRMNPKALELMRAIKASGRKIGILTNMSRMFYSNYYVKCAAEYRALADVEVVSGLHRLHKPERPIFDLTAERLGLAPGRLLFLDDTQANVDAALSYGWQSELFDGV